jgi:hypothetical protein
MGGLLPADSLSQSGDTGASSLQKEGYSYKKDCQRSSLQYITTEQYTVVPPSVCWETPEWLHTDIAPFCHIKNCMCHYQHWRMEQYVVEPLCQHESVTIAMVLDLYHGEVGAWERMRAAIEERIDDVMVEVGA